MKSKISKKVGRPPPEWLISLPSGEYTIEKLIEKSGGKHISTIIRVIKKHGARSEKTEPNKQISKMKYIWKNPWKV